MYFPFRNRLLDVSLGVERGSSLALAPPRAAKPLVYYGTSIVHGAFAIRPSLGIAQILGRALDLPVVNLGFSGAARLEREMAALLAEIDARAFLCDPFHNLDAAVARANTVPFIETLCSARPETPVFMVGAPLHLQAWLRPDLLAAQEETRAAYATLCQSCLSRFPRLRFLPGDDFYGSDEVSMDGIHPNDLAFAHMAEVLAGELGPAHRAP